MGSKGPGKIFKLNMEELKRLVDQEQSKYEDKLPANVIKGFEVDTFVEAGCKCYRLIPKTGFNGTYIVYLYGGGMCKNITNAQWEFISRISIKTGVGLYIPMYPLAPEKSCKDTFDMLKKAYSNFVKGFDVEKVVLMGDSSGAGLALSLTMLSWKEGYRKPDQLIMLSPVLDTEYFDKDLEKQLLERGNNDPNYFYNETAREFINTYWVKDYAVKTEYTSPFYEDYTDLCDDVVVFAGEADMFDCYNKAFYTRAKAQGVNVRYYAFEEEKHNFMILDKSDVQEKAEGYLVDVINNTYETSLHNIYPIKLLSDWSKRYPEVIKDDWASKFVYGHKFKFTNMGVKMTEYRSMLQAANFVACDDIVKKFIMKYPKCTIVHIGCKLDNMFNRQDNGRIQWYSLDTYNIMSVRRAMYGERYREKTIGRSLMDFSWLDEISCKRNQGVLFVCRDTLTHYRLNEVKALFEAIREKFPGSEIAFTAATSGATLYHNIGYKKRVSKSLRRMSIDDAQKILNGWRVDYKIMYEGPVLKCFKKEKDIKLSTKIGIAYNLISYNHKIIHVKLGSEAYDLNI